VLDAIGWQAASLDQLAVRTGLGLPALVLAIERLRAAGWIDSRGGWFERIGRERAGG
jgi:hypothetical protein